jgi:hypothetical protein
VTLYVYRREAGDEDAWRWHGESAFRPVEITDEMVDEIAEALYAAGPWGDFFAFADSGVRAITDAHTMTVYRAITQQVIAALHWKQPLQEEGDNT